jgi:hypothetical protein
LFCVDPKTESAQQRTHPCKLSHNGATIAER